MSDTTLIILGLIMFYSWGHFLFVQHTTEYKKRTTYEKVITWSAMGFFILYLIGSN